MSFIIVCTAREGMQLTSDWCSLPAYSVLNNRRWLDLGEGYYESWSIVLSEFAVDADRL